MLNTDPRATLFNAALYGNRFGKFGRIYQQCDDAERKLRDTVPHYLESYHYVNKESYVAQMRQDKVKVFLDSGAFSAYTQKVTIDIGAYCDYCARNRDIIRFPSVLDVIDFDDLSKAIKGTYHNQMEMERRFKAGGVCFEETGYGPLPVAHYGEPDEVIQHYVDNYGYMALGGLVPVSTKQMILWLDHIFERIVCDANGYPKVRVHGFGVTSLPVMLRYPWGSVDSSTWVQWSSNGFVLEPLSGIQINVSSKSSARKIKGQHIDSVSGIEREELTRRIAAHGVDPQRLRDKYQSRFAYNAWAFPEYIRTRKFPERFIREQPGLF